MEFLFCPDCCGSDFAEDFDCRECQTSLLIGKKITAEQRKRNLQLSGQMISVSTQKVIKKPSKHKIFAGAGSFIVVVCLVALVYSGLFFGRAKTLKTIESQLSAQNDLNKFSVETNDAMSLTAISLVQESVKISTDNKSFSNIKLLFDCVIDGNILTRTPKEYRITIIPTDSDRKLFESSLLEFQTEKEKLTVEKIIDAQSIRATHLPEYVSFRISRKQLANIARSTQINFGIGKYQGQLNFAQQQSLRSFLTATSMNDKIE
jgi:uncharacterized protein YneF (UPF0154 family)